MSNLCEVITLFVFKIRESNAYDCSILNILIQDTISVNCDNVIDQSISDSVTSSKRSFDDISDISLITKFVSSQMSSNKIKTKIVKRENDN